MLSGTGASGHREMPPAGTRAILLVRHGRPALARKGRMGWRAFNDWWRSYNESGLKQGEEPPAGLAMVVSEAVLVRTSPLPRARQTADLLSAGREVIADALFVEAPLPAPPLPLLKVSPGVWWVMARVFWWLGFAGGLESRVMAEDRARQAAERLIDLSAEGTVLLCGHGWFNRMIGKVLRHRGWYCDIDGGDDYWSLRRYVTGPRRR